MSKHMIRLLVRVALTASAGLLGATGLWSTLWAPAAKATRVPVTAGVTDEQNRSGKVLLALDQAVLSVKEYVRTRDAAERDEFEKRLRGYQGMLDVLGADPEADVRQVGEALKKRAAALATLGRFVVSQRDPGVSTEALTRLHELVALRDEAVTTVSELRELDLARAAKEAEKTDGTVAGLLGGGFVTLGLALAGAAGIARYMIA